MMYRSNRIPESQIHDVQVRMNVLEDALDKQDLGLPPLVVEDHSVFGTVQAQSSQAPGYVSQPIFPFPSHTVCPLSFY